MIGLARGLGNAARSLVNNQRPLRQTSLSLVQKKYGSTLYYREAVKTTRKSHIGAEALMTVFWYWVMFHVYYDFDHLIGHFDYPDPSKWTDEELGIPSDDQD